MMHNCDRVSWSVAAVLLVGGCNSQSLAIGSNDGGSVPDTGVLVDRTTGTDAGDAAYSPCPTWGLRLATMTPAGTPFEGLAVGNLDGDGNPDVLVGQMFGSTILLPGAEGGGFGAPIPNRWPAATSFGLGDLNRDGKMDIAMAAYRNEAVTVVTGNGDGTFQTPVNFSLGAQHGPLSLVMADFNRDDKLDVAVADQDGSGLTHIDVLLGNGDGTLRAPVVYAGGRGNPQYQALAVGDLNADGVPDFALANDQADTVSVLIGVGDGTFRAERSFPTGTTSSPSAVVLGDLDGDGKSDLAITMAPSLVGVLRGNGDGTFGAVTPYAVSNAAGIAIGDIDGDSRPDMVVANSSGSIGVLRADGEGGFHPQVTFATGYPLSGPQSVAIADIDGDTRLDVIITDNLAGAVLVFLNGCAP